VKTQDWLLVAVWTIVVSYFEPYLPLAKAIGVLVVIDILTGYLASRHEGQGFQSRKFREKLKPVALFLIALAAAKEASPLLAEFDITAHQAGKWFCAFYGVYELFSILENLGRLGLPIAAPLMKLLKAKLPDDVNEAMKSKD